MAGPRRGTASDDGAVPHSPKAPRASARESVRLALVTGALGVVFGRCGHAERGSAGAP